MKKTAGMILTLIILLTAALVFFACDKTPEFAPNGICISENYIFFPTAKSDLHNSELKEAFENFIASSNPYWTPAPDYEVYNFVDAKTSKRYDIDIFQTYHKEEERVLYYVRQGQDVYALSSANSVYTTCLTNCAITDIDHDGNIEILVACLVIFDDTNSHSNVYVIDTNTKTSTGLTYYDSASYFKESEDGVVSIYNLSAGKTPAQNDGESGVLDRSYFDKATVLADAPMLNALKFDFKGQSFEVSCDLFNAEVTVVENDNMHMHPYLFADRLIRLPFEIEVHMTYLGAPFEYVEPSYDPKPSTSKLLLDGYILGYYTSTINSRWWEPPTKHSVETNQQFATSTFNIVPVNELQNIVGTYDLVVSFDVEYNSEYSEEFPEVSSVSIHDQIVIEDFLTITA